MVNMEADVPKAIAAALPFPAAPSVAVTAAAALGTTVDHGSGQGCHG